jgi:betaine-aldehyde dehydrogenase
MSSEQATTQEPDIGFKPRGLYIGGAWQDAADGRTFETINPSTGRKLGEVPYAGPVDVDRAVQAAKQAFLEWRRVTVRERARCLELLAKRIREQRNALGLMDALDAGNAVTGMRGDMDWTADSLEHFAGLVTEIKGETSSQGPRHLNFTRRQPFGVVGKINPFNHPFRFCAELITGPSPRRTPQPGSSPPKPRRRSAQRAYSAEAFALNARRERAIEAGPLPFAVRRARCQRR